MEIFCKKNSLSESIPRLMTSVIDKNSLLLDEIYEKGNCVLRKFLQQDPWVCLGAFSAGIRGIFGVEVASGYFQRLGQLVSRF
jgi:hypothetical protein